ncbi:cytochrome b5 isoform X2 [Eupeodes corollae]|uniref:cytochrome b5 isoform X2 n=2 Tax=Eupeodes corollae TaxID=290404 RepID=UPI002492F2C6|nr:cytochrome b5 isoform X2 [Eupeodes corollae]
MSVVKEIPLEVVKQHNKKDDLWLVIEDKVYDLTKFRLEHPGGEETLDDSAGRDATRDFIDAGHSSEARTMMKKYLIGELPAADRKKPLPIREIGLAVGAIVIGIATVFIIKKMVLNKN